MKIKTLEIKCFFSGAHHCFCLFIHHTIWSYQADLATEQQNGNVSWRWRAQIKQLAWLMAEQFGRAANWAPEVEFSLFRSLSRRQLLLNQPIVLNTWKKVYLPNFLTQKYPGVENFKPNKPRQLKSGVPTPWAIIFPKLGSAVVCFSHRLSTHFKRIKTPVLVQRARWTGWCSFFRPLSSYLFTP